jgi:DtxR family Mn-dependent transcriptional regulator
MYIQNHALFDDSQVTPVERSYLEVIAYLADRREPVYATHLVRWLHVRAPTVTHTLQRLEAKQFIQRTQQSAISLTDSGGAIAERIIRRHRLLERFLYDYAKVPWHEVHREASSLEPVLSPRFEAFIVSQVGDAKTCPHGNPIPGQGAVAVDDQRIFTLAPGQSCVITRIDEEAGQDPCMFQLLWVNGIVPNVTLTRLLDPSDGVAVRRDHQRILLPRRVAATLWGVQQPTDVSNL